MIGETHCRVWAKALSLSTRGKFAEGGGGAISFFFLKQMKMIELLEMKKG
jgi:hypothetical protein